jgi:hypothetical protein
VSCGDGDDVVIAPRATTAIRAGCEALLFRLPRGTFTDDQFLGITPRPERREGRLGFEIRCPELDGEPQRCSAAIRIREAATHRLVAEGSVPPRRRGSRFLRLTLTPLGRRLVRTPGRVRATTTVSGRPLPTARWTTRF